MKAIDFPESNLNVGKDQPEYLNLPAYVYPLDPRYRLVFCWKLTLRERFKLLFTGKIWHSVLTFRKPLQPQAMQLDKPPMSIAAKPPVIRRKESDDGR